MEIQIYSLGAWLRDRSGSVPIRGVFSSAGNLFKIIFRASGGTAD